MHVITQTVNNEKGIECNTEINNLQENKIPFNTEDSSNISLNSSNTIIISNKGRKMHLLTSEILFMKAESNYTVIHTLDRKYITSCTLKYWENMLNHLAIFQRVHRSYVINVNYIQTYAKKVRQISLSNNYSIPIARRYSSDFKEQDYKKIN